MTGSGERLCAPRPIYIETFTGPPLGAAMLLGTNVALSGKLAWTPGGYGIVFARMMEEASSHGASPSVIVKLPELLRKGGTGRSLRHLTMASARHRGPGRMPQPGAANA
jgi:hypothetical protein